MSDLVVGPVAELAPGQVKIVRAGALSIGVFNANGELYAIEDRCSHDDGPLAEGDWEPEECVAICPRHGARFDIRTGRALSLPAYLPVETFPVRVEDGLVILEVPQ
jgi:3-phenylpropionate/trans-cinnamate dioxygenase ferredoxin subunit